MSLKDQWWSIEDWADAHGITLADALGEGISQNNDDTIDIPESYHWQPLVAASDYYDTVDVELYLSCEDVSQITEIVDFLLDDSSKFRKLFHEETHGMEYDEEHTKFMLGKQAYFFYLRFIKGRESEFAYPLSYTFPEVNITVVSTNPDINYWAENVFFDHSWTVNEESKYADKAPDIYREYLEDKANS